MFFQIDPQNGVPVYEQVARQVTFAVASGALQPGELVPSVRQLARDLAINPNTVSRAYRQLQDEQILEAVRGTGLQVASGARARCKTDRRRIIGRDLGQVVDQARQSQLSDQEIHQLFQAELKNSRNKHKSE